MSGLATDHRSSCVTDIEYIGIEYIDIEYIDIEYIDIEYIDIAYIDIAYIDIAYIDIEYCVTDIEELMEPPSQHNTSASLYKEATTFSPDDRHAKVCVETIRGLGFG